MKKINLTIGTLLVSSLFFASYFVACSGGSSTGTAGTNGGAGTAPTGTAGTSATGTAGTGSSVTDGGATTADGRCVQGAYPRDGVCMCQPSNPDVCAMKCTDMKLDNANCGMCGKACDPTSTCNNGTCGPAPTAVVPAAAGCMSMYIAVGNGNIYWTDLGHKTVKSMPVAGGAAVTISSTETGPTWVALRGTSLFWLDGMVIKKSVAGAAPTVVYTSPTKVNGFTVSADGAKVYLSTGVAVKQVLTATTTVDVALEEHEGLPGALALDGNTMVYPTDLNGDVDIVYLKDGMVAKCGKDDPVNVGQYLMVNCTRIARSQGSLLKESVLAFGGKVYWVDGTSIKSGDSSPDAAASNDTIASTLEKNITTLTSNATTIYFAEDGIIEKTPLAKDSTPIQIARGQMSPTSIAVDATKVYWSTSDCAISSTGL